MNYKSHLWVAKYLYRELDICQKTHLRIIIQELKNKTLKGDRTDEILRQLAQEALWNKCILENMDIHQNI